PPKAQTGTRSTRRRPPTRTRVRVAIAPSARLATSSSFVMGMPPLAFPMRHIGEIRGKGYPVLSPASEPACEPRHTCDPGQLDYPNWPFFTERHGPGRVPDPRSRRPGPFPSMHCETLHLASTVSEKFGGSLVHHPYTHLFSRRDT